MGVIETTLIDWETNFMYDVWCNVLQTDVGKNLVRDHKDTHTIYKKLLAHYEISAMTTIKGHHIMDYLATTWLGPNSSWNGTYHNFIQHFKDQVRLQRQPPMMRST